MKARLTGKPAETKKNKNKEYDELDLLNDLIETGLIDEETEMNVYPTSTRNVINHNKDYINEAEKKNN